MSNTGLPKQIPVDQIPRKSNLQLVEECDNFPYPAVSPKEYEKVLSGFHQFKVANIDQPLGLIPSWAVSRFTWDSDWTVNNDAKTVTLHASETGDLDQAFAKLAESERSKGTFEVLSGWRDELYGVYGPDKKLLMGMERSASPLFGINTFGVHMTAYVKEGDRLKIWVPRRSPTKSTYGGMLDNTVAGGISVGEDPFESLVRESHEEASIPEGIVRKGAKAVGTVTYLHLRDSRAGGETGLCQPECQYIYDLELPSSFVPEPEDDEVQHFHLMEIEEIQERLANGEFKPNCAAVMVDFFIRHGILRHDNEENYIEIVSRLHRRLEFPTP